MALQKTVTTKHGFTAVNAYHRIEVVSLIGKEQINFHVRSYVNANKPFFDEQVVTSFYQLDGENPIAQGYAYLKTLPEFAGAIDC